MNDTDFYSSHTYLYLPTRQNPRVALAVDTADTVANAFALYSPFSIKAKFLKLITRYFFRSLNPLAKSLWNCQKQAHSPFAHYLETILDEPLILSLYFATIHDKVVIQVQSKDNKILGYIKYPLNAIGVTHLYNEKKAYESLSAINIIRPYLLSEIYQTTPFLMIPSIQGKIAMVPKDELFVILEHFKSDKKYPLNNHPRVLYLQRTIANDVELSQFATIIEHICSHTTDNYALVYEHGDFTPWNIIYSDGKYIPFDFEHFVEEGLEYFDLIKYYYQIGKLLKKMTYAQLTDFIYKQIPITDFSLIFKLFLLKEIIQKKTESENYDYEIKLLNLMEK